MQSLQSIKAKIKNIGAEKLHGPQEEQIKRNLQSSLAAQLQELSITFKKNQKDYLTRTALPSTVESWSLADWLPQECRSGSRRA